MSSIAAQISEVEREIHYRERVYPNQVRLRHMRQAEADLHLARMRDVLKTLREYQAMERLAFALSRDEEPPY